MEFLSKRTTQHATYREQQRVISQHCDTEAAQLRARHKKLVQMRSGNSTKRRRLLELRQRFVKEWKGGRISSKDVCQLLLRCQVCLP